MEERKKPMSNRVESVSKQTNTKSISQDIVHLLQHVPVLVLRIDCRERRECRILGNDTCRAIEQVGNNWNR